MIYYCFDTEENSGRGRNDRPETCPENLIIFSFHRGVVVGLSLEDKILVLLFIVLNLLQQARRRGL